MNGNHHRPRLALAPPATRQRHHWAADIRDFARTFLIACGAIIVSGVALGLVIYYL